MKWNARSSAMFPALLADEPQLLRHQVPDQRKGIAIDRRLRGWTRFTRHPVRRRPRQRPRQIQVQRSVVPHRLFRVGPVRDLRPMHQMLRADVVADGTPPEMPDSNREGRRKPVPKPAAPWLQGAFTTTW